MQIKKRDIIILAGLGLIVLLVAWYFLVIGPKRDATAAAQVELDKEMQLYQDNTNKVKRLDEERTAAKQTSGEILRLNKLVPADEEVPSLIVEMQQTANEAGIKFIRIEPGDVVAGDASGTIIPFKMVFQGNFFDVNDFLYRVENYARMEGNDVNVSGRLLSVIGLVLKEPDTDPKFPQVQAELDVNAFMTSPAPTKAVGTASSAGSSSAAGGSASATGAANDANASAAAAGGGAASP